MRSPKGKIRDDGADVPGDGGGTQGAVLGLGRWQGRGSHDKQSKSRGSMAG